MTGNDIIIAALTEAGHPPTLSTPHSDHVVWRPPPPLELVERARDLAYPDQVDDMERIDAASYSTAPEFGVWREPWSPT
jgi:hypothetical protein